MTVINKIRLLTKRDILIIGVMIFVIISMIGMGYNIYLFNVNCIGKHQILFGTIKEQFWCLNHI